MMALFVVVHIYVSRTSIGDASASSFRKRLRLVHVAFAIVEITLLLRSVLWINIAIALHDAAVVHLSCSPSLHAVLLFTVLS
jgi:hypothetical protein